MRADLILVCHASTAAVRSARFPADEALDDAGWAAAGQTASVLLSRPFDSAWSAPAVAARQTAQALGLTADVEPAIADCDLGRWRGRPLAEVARDEPVAFSQWMSDPDWAGHGGESHRRLQQRVSAWVDQLHSGARTVAVTHPSVIRAAIVGAIGANPETFWHLDIGPLSQTHLRSNGSRWALRAILPRASSAGEDSASRSACG
jgi:broad specificity phosphatase PhoE